MSMESDDHTLEANGGFLNEDQIKKAFRETFAEIVKERSAAGDNDPSWRRTSVLINVVPNSNKSTSEISEWHGLLYAWISNPRVKQILLGISETGEKTIQIVDPNWIPPKYPMNIERWIEENPEPEMEEPDEKSAAITAFQRKKDWNYVSPEEEEYEEEMQIWEKNLEDYKNKYSAPMITIELEPFPVVPVQYTDVQYTQSVNLWKKIILSKYTDFDQDFLDNFTNNLLTQFNPNDTIENNKMRYNELLDDLQVFYDENEFDANLDPKLLPPFSSVYMKPIDVKKKFPPNPNKYNNAPVVDSSMLTSKPTELWVTTKILYPLIAQFSSDKEIDKKTGQLKFPIITELQVNDKKLGPKKIFTIKFSNKSIYKQNCLFARLMIRKLKLTNPDTKETTTILLNWKYENSYSDNNSVKSGASRGSGGKYQNQKYQNPPTVMPRPIDVNNNQTELKMPLPVPAPRGWNIPVAVPPVVQSEKIERPVPQQKIPVQYQKNQQYSKPKNQQYPHQKNTPIQRSNSPQGGLKRGASPLPIRRAQSPPKNVTSEECEWQVQKNSNKKFQQKKDKR